MKVSNVVKLLLVLIVLLGAFLFLQKVGLITVFCPSEKPLTEERVTGVNFEVLEESIVEILELATASYDFTVNYSESKDKVTTISWLPEITLGQKKYTFSVNGQIKGGFVLTDREILEVDEMAKTLVFTLPEPEIVATVSDDQITVVTEEGTIFNKPDSSDYKAAVANCREKIETRALEQGLLKDAKTNVEKLLTSFMAVLQENALAEYTVEIKYQ